MILKSPTYRPNTVERVTTSEVFGSAITQYEAKEWCRIDSDQDSSTVLELVSDMLELYQEMLNLSMFNQTVDVTYSSFGKKIMLPLAPVQSITSVKTLKDKELPYEIIGDTLFMEELSDDGLKVIYKAGFKKLPGGLKLSLKQAILSAYNDREDNVMGGVGRVFDNSRRKAMKYKRWL